MVTEVERLIVRLEASQRTFERQLARANQTAARRANQIERRFTRMNATLSAGFSRLGVTLAGAFASGAILRGAQRLIDANTRIENSLKAVGLEGEELSTVYNRLFDIAQKNLTPWESLATLYQRLALTSGELNLSQQDLLLFTERVAQSLRLAGTSASEASGALLQLSQAIGGGIVRAEEFNSILEGAPTIAQAMANGLEEAGGSVARLRQLVVDGALSSEAAFHAFIAGSEGTEQALRNVETTSSQALGALRDALIKTAGEFDEATGTSENFAAAILYMAESINSISFGPLIEQINAAEAAMGRLGNSGVFQRLNEFLGVGGGEFVPGVGIVVDETKALNRELEILQDRVELNTELGFDNTDAKARLAEVETQLDRIKVKAGGAGPARMGDPDAFKDFSDVGAPAVQPISIADFPVGGSSGGGGGGSGGGGRGGGGGRKSVADSMRDATEATKEFERAQRDAEQAAEDLGGVVGGAVSSLVGAFQDGKIESEELLGIVGQLASQLIRLSGIGGFGGGFLSSILGGVFHEGGVVGRGGSKRSVHPAMFAGAPRYHSGGIAGLKPGEVPAILQKGEMVIPKGQSLSGGQSIVINAPINAPGADAAALARVEKQVQDLGRNIPKMVDKRTSTRELRRTRA